MPISRATRCGCGRTASTPRRSNRSRRAATSTWSFARRTTCSCAASRFCNAAASMPATCPCPRRSRRTNTCCAPTRSTCATSAATISSRNPFRSIPTDNPKNDGAARRRAPSTWPSSPKAATSSTDSPAAWGSRPWAGTDFRGR